VGTKLFFLLLLGIALAMNMPGAAEQMLAIPLVWLGAVYPVVVAIVLWRMDKSESRGGLDDVNWMFPRIGWISIWIAGASVLLSFILEAGAIKTLRANELPKTGAWFAAIEFPLGSIVPAAVLILGGYRLMKYDPRGVRLHRVYIGLKLAASVLGTLAIAGVRKSELGAEYFDASIAITTSFGAVIYPIVLMLVLPDIEKASVPLAVAQV